MKTVNKCIALFAIVLVAGILTAPENAVADTTLTLDVMCYNVRWNSPSDGSNQWPYRKDSVAALIGSYTPDILGIQEAERFQINDLEASLPLYNDIGEGRDGDTTGEHSAILYRSDKFTVDTAGTFWLSDTPEVPSTSFGNNLHRICTWGRFTDTGTGITFYVYNTHFDHKSQASREASAKLIMSRIHARAYQDTFMLMGDLNAGEANTVITYLKGTPAGSDTTPLPLVDTYRVINPDSTNVGTARGFNGNSSYTEKIDYIFCSPGTNVLSAAIDHTNNDGLYPSDHFPIMARLLIDAHTSGIRPAGSHGNLNNPHPDTPGIWYDMFGKKLTHSSGQGMYFSINVNQIHKRLIVH